MLHRYLSYFEGNVIQVRLRCMKKERYIDSTVIFGEESYTGRFVLL